MGLFHSTQMHNQLQTCLHREYEAVKLLYTHQKVLEKTQKTMHIRAYLWQWSTNMKFMQIQRENNTKMELYAPRVAISLYNAVNLFSERDRSC